MIAKFCTRWDTWWMRQTRPHCLALVRITLGLFLLVYAGLYGPHVAMLFSNQGVAMPLYLDAFPQWAVILDAPSVVVAWSLYLLLLISLLLFTVGLYMRIGILLVLLISLFFWQLQLHLFAGTFNRLYFLTLLILLFSGADRTLSLRMKMTRGAFTAWEPVSIWPQRLLAVQLTFTYWGVGWQKLWLPLWQTGEVLVYAFIGRWGTPLSFAIVRLGFPLELYDAWVFLLKLFEFVLPFGFWWKLTRWWTVVGGVLFHLLLTALLSMWWFLVLIPMYVLFFDPEEVQDYLVRKKCITE